VSQQLLSPVLIRGTDRRGILAELRSQRHRLLHRRTLAHPAVPALHVGEFVDIDIDEFPNVKRWLEEIGERPAVKKAMALGPEFREDPATISAEEQTRRARLVQHQRAQKVPAEWQSAAAE